LKGVAIDIDSYLKNEKDVLNDLDKGYGYSNNILG
jgi:hypothetical protein